VCSGSCGSLGLLSVLLPILCRSSLCMRFRSRWTPDVGLCRHFGMLPCRVFEQSHISSLLFRSGVGGDYVVVEEEAMSLERCCFHNRS
jgi:hypothetical protein